MKPQNVIISEMHSCCKLIDLGAAADLRIGINYIPDEYLLDPRYAPPQQYIMSPQTVRRAIVDQSPTTAQMHKDGAAEPRCTGP